MFTTKPINELSLLPNRISQMIIDYMGDFNCIKV